MIDLNAELPSGSPRPLPKRVPSGSHILSHSDLRAVARHFAGRDHARLGEELIGLILPGMLDAETGRHIPHEVLAELGNGDHVAGRKVLRKFLDNIRHRDPLIKRQHGGRVERARMSKADAGYEPSGDENRICVICSMFRPDNKCTLVAGFIDRTGTCDHFESAKRAKSNAAE